MYESIQFLQNLLKQTRRMSKRDILLSGSRKSMDRQSQTSSQLHNLVERFERISSSIHIDTNTKNFKFLQMDKPMNHFKDDPHTLLRNLQNKSQINRAQVELLSQRRPKHYSIKQNRYQMNENQQTYISIYHRLKNQRIIKDKNDTELTSQDDFLDGSQHTVNGVKHFTLLRHHPRILQYTLEKIRDKSLERKLEMKKNENKEIVKSASKPSSLSQNQEYKQIIQNLNTKIDPLETPKAIVDNQMTKFYSKSSKGKLDVKIKDNPRCVKILQKQQQLVTHLEDKSISKENMKKLKERLNIIVNEISKSDKKRSIEKFPKITPFNQQNDEEK